MPPFFARIIYKIWSLCCSKPDADKRPKSLSVTSDADDGRYTVSVPVYNCATSPIRHTTIGTVVTTAKDLAMEVRREFDVF